MQTNVTDSNFTQTEVVESERDDTELRLTGSFREHWLARIQTFRIDTPQRTAQLASMIDADPAAITEQRGESLTLQGGEDINLRSEDSGG